MTEDDILDLYGQCRREKCICLTTGWLGSKCLSWVSFGAKTFDELKIAQQNLNKAKKGS